MGGKKRKGSVTKTPVDGSLATEMTCPATSLIMMCGVSQPCVEQLEKDVIEIRGASPGHKS